MKINAAKYKTNEILKFIRQGLDLTQEELANKIALFNQSVALIGPR